MLLARVPGHVTVRLDHLSARAKSGDAFKARPARRRLSGAPPAAPLRGMPAWDPDGLKSAAWLGDVLKLTSIHIEEEKVLPGAPAFTRAADNPGWLSESFYVPADTAALPGARDALMVPVLPSSGTPAHSGSTSVSAGLARPRFSPDGRLCLSPTVARAHPCRPLGALPPWDSLSHASPPASHLTPSAIPGAPPPRRRGRRPGGDGVGCLEAGPRRGRLGRPSGPPRAGTAWRGRHGGVNGAAPPPRRGPRLAPVPLGARAPGTGPPAARPLLPGVGAVNPRGPPPCALTNAVALFTTLLLPARTLAYPTFLATG